MLKTRGPKKARAVNERFIHLQCMYSVGYAGNSKRIAGYTPAEIHHGIAQMEFSFETGLQSFTPEK